MNKDEIKQYIYDNPENIKSVLEALNCNYIKCIKNKYYVCSQPNGDNKGAINVFISNKLTVKHRTRNEFENLFKLNNDIFALVQYLQNIDFPSAIKFVADACGLKHTNDSKKKERSSSADFLRQFKKKEIQIDNYKEVLIEYRTQDRFITGYDTIFLDDGVSSEAHDVFEVSYDPIDNRVVFPIKNDTGGIVTFKGRTMYEDYKLLNIPKFKYYTSFDARYYLFGMYENYYDLLLADEIYLVESEKGVMQCYSFGIRNVLSTSKKRISEEQVKKLLQFGKAIVLCFDKDVTYEEIYEECRKFKRLTDVYYIWDKDNLLKDKESPCDKGFDIWNKLCTEYKYKFEV